MLYNFDTDVAKEYGVDGAIMIANLQYWIIKNKANEKGFYDGHYWTYNSISAFCQLFPFWSGQNIKTILKHLKEKGVIIVGNYNKNKYDKTNWYAFADEDYWLKGIKNDKKSQPIDWLELTNQEDSNNQPIPNSKPNNKQNNNNKSICSSEAEPITTHFKELWNKFADAYTEKYPRHEKIAHITRAEIPQLSTRTQELKRLVKELIADGVIKQEDVGDDIWHWALLQVWLRIQKNAFLRGECEPTKEHPNPFVFNIKTFMAKSNFMGFVSPLDKRWDR